MKSKQELQELRDRGVPELLEELKQSRNRLFQDRVRFATRNLDNSNPLRAGRKRVARILTLLREAELKERAAETKAPRKVEIKERAADTRAPRAGRKRR